MRLCNQFITDTRNSNSLFHYNWPKSPTKEISLVYVKISTFRLNQGNTTRYFFNLWPVCRLWHRLCSNVIIVVRRKSVFLLWRLGGLQQLTSLNAKSNNISTIPERYVFSIPYLYTGIFNSLNVRVRDSLICHYLSTHSHNTIVNDKSTI
mgnify:CR=1 FL=1